MYVHFAPEMWEKPREDRTSKLRSNTVPTLISFTSSVKKNKRKSPAKRNGRYRSVFFLFKLFNNTYDIYTLFKQNNRVILNNRYIILLQTKLIIFSELPITTTSASVECLIEPASSASSHSTSSSTKVSTIQMKVSTATNVIHHAVSSALIFVAEIETR